MRLFQVLLTYGGDADAKKESAVDGLSQQGQQQQELLQFLNV
jgi:hypothetical protein